MSNNTNAANPPIIKQIENETEKLQRLINQAKSELPTVANASGNGNRTANENVNRNRNAKANEN